MKRNVYKEDIVYLDIVSTIIDDMMLETEVDGTEQHVH